MPPKKPEQKPSLKIIGSSFFPETRTLEVLFSLNSVGFTTDSSINVFGESGQIEWMKTVSPGGTMPTLIDGLTTVVADGPDLYRYACYSQNIEEQFYPRKEANIERRSIIDGLLDWESIVLKHAVERVTKMYIQKCLLRKEALSNLGAIYSEDAEKQGIA